MHLDEQAFVLVDEIPFDFVRRRLSVIVSDPHGGQLMVSKGAVEEILAVCTRAQHGDEILPLTPDLLARMRDSSSSTDAARGIMADVWAQNNNIPFLTTVFEAVSEVKPPDDQKR